MRLFKAHVDTINAHAESAEYHPKLYKDNLTTTCKSENTAYEDATKTIREAALDESSTEYLSC